jgi:hypothetical protein
MTAQEPAPNQQERLANAQERTAGNIDTLVSIFVRVPVILGLMAVVVVLVAAPRLGQRRGVRSSPGLLQQVTQQPAKEAPTMARRRLTSPARVILTGLALLAGIGLFALGPGAIDPVVVPDDTAWRTPGAATTGPTVGYAPAERDGDVIVPVVIPHLGDGYCSTCHRVLRHHW